MTPFPFLLADLGDWIKLGLLMLPVLALLYRALIGDQDEQSQEQQHRADTMDRVLGERSAQSAPRSSTYGSQVVEAEIVEPRHLSSIRSDREFSQRVSQDMAAHATGTKIQDEVRKFENRHVGHLSDREGEEGGATSDSTQEEAAPSPVTPMVELSPERMRQAFILREILRRPEW